MPADPAFPDLPPITPGLLALHGNCAETLAQALIDWSSAHPLAPLEQEVVLVQSNGTAEWFKMLQAQRSGICAATRVELPARFLWRSWRQILGVQRVPSISPLDEQPMTWRLMRLLPACLDDPAFAPIARFLRPEQPQRLLQLASRLADLFDQYQVYRSDWLLAWEAGRDELPGLPGQDARPLPAGQEWQPHLWRAVLADLSAQERAVTRPALRAQVLETLNTAPVGSLPVARRVLLLGLTHMPLSMLEFLAALSRHSQIVLAVPNPCRFHWADAIDGRELLRQQRRRHPLRQGRDLTQIPLQAMHAHAHPLLMAWGRQSRDYVRLLDEFESSSRLEQAISRVNLYDEAPADEGTLLQQVQRSIRDLLPVAEHPRQTRPEHAIAASDDSIVLHSAHSLVRELEVLHDHLLRMLAQPATADRPALQPRDIIVMLPDIAQAAPAIRAVFGQYGAGSRDARHIPFAIADLSASAASPLTAALAWLLRLPQQRCRISELADLLDVPALAARLGLQESDAPQLRQWMAAAGIRWGLNAEQRRHLALDACGDTNSAWFGLQRMLLGYASGAQPIHAEGLPRSAAWDDIEPFAEVGGLEAELAGILAALLQRLLAWWEEALQPATPLIWAQRLRQLLADLFEPQDELERAVLQGLEQALQDWLRACEHARFDEALPLSVVQPAWLQALEQPALQQRFGGGGVTFCTFMPMRAIPFELVCLLGMNEGDYPRQSPRSPMDLMQLPGQYRPGDRARRDHDRQLMLDALLSARRQLYISWAGHHVRDNSLQPPSVLVAQLMDYLRSGWRAEDEEHTGIDVVAQRSHQHPLQPFSRRYFEVGSPLFTYAHEWHSAHVESTDAEAAPPAPLPAPDTANSATLQQLTQFLQNPARHFLRQQLQVVFDEDDSQLDDDECFTLAGLDAYLLVSSVQTQVSGHWQQQPDAPLDTLLQAELQRLQRSGQLPLASLGTRAQQQLLASLLPGMQAWQQLLQHYPHSAPHHAVDFVHEGLQLQDWLDQLRRRTSHVAWLQLVARDVVRKDAPRLDKLLPVYLRCLAAAATGLACDSWIVGRDGCLHITPLEREAAAKALADVLQAWHAGQATALPLPPKTALALVQDGDARSAYEGGNKGDHAHHGEVEHMAWARLFPDFDALSSDGRLDHWAQRLYAPLCAWGEACVHWIAWDDLAQALQAAQQEASTAP